MACKRSRPARRISIPVQSFSFLPNARTGARSACVSRSSAVAWPVQKSRFRSTSFSAARISLFCADQTFSLFASDLAARSARSFSTRGLGRWSSFVPGSASSVLSVFAAPRAIWRIATRTRAGRNCQRCCCGEEATGLFFFNASNALGFPFAGFPAFPELFRSRVALEVELPASP